MKEKELLKAINAIKEQRSALYRVSRFVQEKLLELDKEKERIEDLLLESDMDENDNNNQ